MSIGVWDQFERDLRNEVSGLACCDGKSIVFGEGDPESNVVLIGEAPGAQEDKAARPFVGPAGRMLDEVLAQAGLERDSVWITNVVKCRPTEANNGRLRNRPPSREEFDVFLPWLERELTILDPDALVCLGATAAQAILGRKTVRMGDVRGSWLEGVLGIETLVTYHPSYLLRRTTSREERYAEMVADLRAVHKRLPS
jgi:uracil-DNA glycosylase